MKSIKVVAGILRGLSIAAVLFYGFTALYAAFVIIFARNPELGLFQKEKEDGFVINFPFTHKPFLLGDNNPHFLVMLVVTFAGYGIFAYLIKRVCEIFRQDKLFTEKAVLRLKQFYLFNLIVPGSILLINLFFTRDVSDGLAVTVLHGIIGVFAWFLAVIFRQGLALQEEQDLTL
jgi:hypothetical protein